MRREYVTRKCGWHGEVKLPRLDGAVAGDLPVMLEIIPPAVTLDGAHRMGLARQIARACCHLPIRAFNIPEVRDESRNGPRRIHFRAKISPREFANLLRRAYQEHSLECPEVIVNRCVPYVPARTQAAWFQRSHEHFGIHSFVLVGGETSQRRYPGPTVPESARLCRSLGFPTLLGGITIPSRRKPGHDDEPFRMIRKARAGIQFFTTQILMESGSVSRLLADYDQLCQRENIRPAPVFLGVAPVSHQRDIEFMKWLGVEVPPAVERYLFRKTAGIAQRSLALAEELVSTILEVARKHAPSCRIGVLVEHVMRYNFDLSVELTTRLLRLASSTRSLQKTEQVHYG
ncbi:MAG: hypothetical protein V2G42_06720 [bacterium JZ-2024 1]